MWKLKIFTIFFIVLPIFGGPCKRALGKKSDPNTSAKKVALPRRFAKLNEARIKQIEAILIPTPRGLMKPYSDRAFWEEPSLQAQRKSLVGRAEKIAAEPFPPWNNEAYLRFSVDGNRREGELMLSARATRLYPLVIAECLENQGRFIPYIEQALREYVSEPTWTLPASDKDLNSFYKREYTVELRAATFGNDLAQTLFLLGDRLSPEIRQQVRAELERRIFAPVRNSIAIGRGHWWLKANMNWNAVCLAGVTNAALAVLPRNQRAFFVAAAEEYSKAYISGFAGDGYASEGPGYWSYGFSAYVRLREGIMRSTSGKIDLFANPKLLNIALYGSRSVITGGLSAPFGDCPFGPQRRPNPDIVRYTDQVLQLGLDPENQILKPFFLGSIGNMILKATPMKNPPQVPNPPVAAASYYASAGVLVSRPYPNNPVQLGVAIKAGGNDNHSHNDIGSYTIGLGDEQPAGDAGGPVFYHADSFNENRYSSSLMNSYGHPVPVIGGHLQKPATEVKPSVIQVNREPSFSFIQMDLASAYDAPGLKSLTRNMWHLRDDDGSVIISDEFEFTTPQVFETAIITHGTWAWEGPDTILTTLGDKTLAIQIEATTPFSIDAKQIDEESTNFLRIGLRLQPSKKGKVTLTYNKR